MSTWISHLRFKSVNVVGNIGEPLDDGEEDGIWNDDAPSIDYDMPGARNRISGA